MTAVFSVSALNQRSSRAALLAMGDELVAAGKFEEKDTVKIVSVEELSDISEFEDENDFVNTGRIGRWERVAIAAGKQSLRYPTCLSFGLPLDKLPDMA
jgi:hypothetical protein